MPLPMRLIPQATRLHTKLVLALALLVALVVATGSYLLVEGERERRLLELEGRATRIADLFSRSLAYPLWNVDRAAIVSQLAALSPNPEVAQFRVTAVNHGTIADVVKLRGPDLADGVVRELPIEYATPGSATPQKIGEIRVVLTRAVAEQAIAAVRHTVLALAAAGVAMIYALTFLLLRRLVSTPLQRLEEMVDRIAAGDLDARCQVQSHDELGRFAERINTMADRLREAGQRLRDSEAQYRGIFENALEGIFCLDRSGGLHHANPALARNVSDQPEAMGVRIGPIQFTTRINDRYEAINPQEEFTAQADKIYAVFSSIGMSDGLPVSIIWYYQGQEILRDEYEWRWGSRANTFAYVRPQGSGIYQVELKIGAATVATDRFEVNP